MKKFKLAIFVLLALVTSSAFAQKKKDNGVYIAGVSASFKDSLVYFTDIQMVDSVKLDKDKLLPERQQYSYQLKTYLENKYSSANRTCFIYFETNKEKLEKSMKKMKDKYQKGGKSIVRQVDSEFKFTKAETY
jgi:hypothetical protein